MPLPIPANRKRPERILYRASKISSEEVEARAAQISREWTSIQQADRKRLGTAKCLWLSRFINRSSNDQE